MRRLVGLRASRLLARCLCVAVALAPSRSRAAAPKPEPEAKPGAKPEPSIDLRDPGERAPGAEQSEMKARVGVNGVGDVFGESEYATELVLVDGVPTLRRRRRPDVGGGVLGIITPIPDWHANFGPGAGATMKLLYRPLGRADRSPPSSTTPFVLGWLNLSWVAGLEQRLYLQDDHWRVHLLTHGGRYNLSFDRLGPSGDGIDYREDSFFARGLVWRRLFAHLYLGAGWIFRHARYDGEDSLDTAVLRGVNYELDYSRSSGPSIELMYDSRDDQFAAARGHHVTFGGEFLPVELGSTTQHGRLHASYAGYVSPLRPLVIAGRLQWQSGFGDVPLAALPRYGGTGDSRGFQPGRFVGRHRATGQIELRWTIREPWGVVFFAELGTVLAAPPSWAAERQSQLILPSGGAGLRFRPSSLSRLNLRADLVVARYGPVGLSLGLGEAF